jgi:hypothetical protein
MVGLEGASHMAAGESTDATSTLRLTWTLPSMTQRHICQ